MPSSFENRMGRWLLRRLERRDRRRLKAAPVPHPRVLSAASLVDGYCEVLGPAGNDDDATGARRRHGPPLALVRN